MLRTEVMDKMMMTRKLAVHIMIVNTNIILEKQRNVLAEAIIQKR